MGRQQRYAEDPQYRARTLEHSARWVQQQKSENLDDYRNRRCESAKKCYEAHIEEYREKKRLYARQYYSARREAAKTEMDLRA